MGAENLQKEDILGDAATSKMNAFHLNFDDFCCPSDNDWRGQGRRKGAGFPNQHLATEVVYWAMNYQLMK